MTLLRLEATESIRLSLNRVIRSTRCVELLGATRTNHQVGTLLLRSSKAEPLRSDWNLSDSPEGS